MNKNKTFWRALIMMCALPILGACASLDHQRNLNPDPNERLDEMLTENEQNRAAGKQCGEVANAKGMTVDCQRVSREVDRLYTEFPEQQRIIMANAVMQFDAGRRENAQFLLDQLLSMPGSHPEAAILRARIAVEEGNLAFAKTVLEKEINLSPEYADLYETLASIYYLEGRYKDASDQLKMATLLGAPHWRIAYHRGLLYEALKRPGDACASYQQAIERNPDFRPARARVIGMINEPACHTVIEATRTYRSGR